MKAVEVNNLRKVYGPTLAVDDVSFVVEPGEIFGLIGPDGSGKTSIFRMLTTLLLPDGGSATVNGHDVVSEYRAIRATVGYMPGRFSLYQDLTVEENLQFFATLFGTTIEANYHLISDIYQQIEKFKTRRAGKLSGGMKQKLALCCALIHKPEVLFLDEPTTGVDPVSRKEFWEMLARLKQQGITILVSTPYMDEAARCDRIALMQNGKVLSIDSPDKLTTSYPRPLFQAKSDNPFALLKALETNHLIAKSYAFGEYAHFALRDDNATEDEIRDALRTQGVTVTTLARIQASIEDRFIDLMS